MVLPLVGCKATPVHPPCALCLCPDHSSWHLQGLHFVSRAPCVSGQLSRTSMGSAHHVGAPLTYVEAVAAGCLRAPHCPGDRGGGKHQLHALEALKSEGRGR